MTQYTIIHEPPMWPAYRHQYVVLVVGTAHEVGRFYYERDARAFIKVIEPVRCTCGAVLASFNCPLHKGGVT